MNDKVTRRVEEIQASDVFKRVNEIQASMVESAKSYFDDSELGHLRAVIRLTLESTTTWNTVASWSRGAYNSSLTWG